MRRNAMNAAAVERELRARLTETEYRVLQARLTGAVKAIATLKERAPDLVPMMFGGLEQAKALAPHTQSSLLMLIEELLAAAATDRPGHIDRRRLLRIVSRVAEHSR